MYIPVILGTARIGRKSERVAKFIFNNLQKFGIDSEIIDVRDYVRGYTTTDKGDEIVAKYAEKVERADGFVFVAPEYNHSFPGELKILIDMLSDEYVKKPAGICGVSSGSFGGTRVVEQLKLIVTSLGMIPVSYTLHVSNVERLLDENGEALDERLKSRVERFIKELVWFAKTLKYGRENIESQEI